MALKAGERQMSMIIPNVEELISADHRYRKLLAIVNWTELAKPLRSLYSQAGRKGYAVEKGLKCLFLQFLEGRSDRQMEQLLSDSLAAKFFCNFGLVEKTPDHSYFSQFRGRIGTYQLSEIFKRIVEACRKKIKRRGLHSMVIKKNNNKDKNHRKDSYLSSLRMPLEGIFSKVSSRARYKGKLKVYFQVLMESIVSNLKRLVVIRVEPIPIS